MTANKKQRVRRPRGDGGYRKRGDSWELKFPVTDPVTGQRKFRYVTFKGNETEARARLRQELQDAKNGTSVLRSGHLVGDLLDAWERTLAVSLKTAERYLELIRLHVRPRIGRMKVQAVRPSTIDALYNDLRHGRAVDGAPARSLAPRTIGHIHRLVAGIFAIAVRDGLISANPAEKAQRPKVAQTEIEILTEEQARDVLTKLRGHRLFPVAALGLATGMRRGELLALRWRDVDLEAAELQVSQSLEETNDGLRFKAPKTKHSRRTISLPAFIVAELRAHRKAQSAERLALGLGKEGDDALVFRRADGSPLSPDTTSSEWRRLVLTLGLPKVSLHALRHTHASQLIASGMDVLTISRRLGHGKPSVTLDVYGHLFKPTDRGAAAVFDKAFGGLQPE